ncbi:MULTISPECIES: hypothetical protein [Pseudomonas]|uniref:hypothetical protein n=1 Tax=Pseudomonas TaxID=286 RepID=UPI000D6F846A|nr:hypothetical protein [Pseudomonas sp. RW407]PWU31601.1 hypothetical protein DK254_03755 [Pseudomonas sp. RW407]
MGNRPLYLVSYILDDQPTTLALHRDGELDAGAALDFLQGLHGPAARISDVQVSRVKRSQERDTTPGHYRQP